MKVLTKNNSFMAIEVPDVKIYTASELKNCSVPPIYVLYNNQLFTFQSMGYDSNEWYYVSNIKGNNLSPNESFEYSMTYDKNINVVIQANTIKNNYHNIDNMLTVVDDSTPAN